MANLAETEIDPGDAAAVAPAGGPPPPIDFNSAYERWFHVCCRWLRAMGVPESDLDDVAQDTFIVVQRNLHRFKGPEDDFAPWLYAIAWRIASDHRRTRWIRYLFRRREPLDEQWIDPSHGPAELLRKREAERLVARALDGMSLKLRVPFVLFELQEYSIAEIARLLQIPARTVQSRLRLARKKFEERIRRLLGPEGKP
jgi:RNA polymerase sigma-70 factor (ECF subfamily)